MKKRVIIILLVLLIVLIVLSSVPSIIEMTGRVSGPPSGDGMMGGPSGEDMACMQACVSIGCGENDDACRVANSEACGLQCGVETEAPEPTDEGEACMQKCVVRGCDEFDFSCQRLNQNVCDDECGMKGDAPDESEMDEEQRCISECVAAEDPSIICGNSQEGETGGAVCQRCANECVYLYSGPCLSDEEITEKEGECNSQCEHCYGEPVEGPSGQGWSCIVDIGCKDSSSEFGDEPGEGPGIGQEGFVANIFEGIGNFFKGIFGG
jgi:hypothetical protein